jgi:hypothetical protein
MREFNLLENNTFIKNSLNVTHQQYVQKYKKNIKGNLLFEIRIGCIIYIKAMQCWFKKRFVKNVDC